MMQPNNRSANFQNTVESESRRGSENSKSWKWLLEGCNIKTKYNSQFT